MQRYSDLSLEYNDIDDITDRVGKLSVDDIAGDSAEEVRTMSKSS